MNRFIRQRACSLLWRLGRFLCLITFVSFASPAAAQTMVRPLAWRETPVIFKDDVVGNKVTAQRCAA